jgi:hypothetical protein
MDTTELNAQFMAHLATLNSDVHACFTSSGTLPASQSPTDTTFALVEALVLTQNEYNQAATAPPYLNIVTRKFDGSPTPVNGQLVRSKERQMNFQEILGPVDVGAPTSTELIIFP